jgi:hypothetical protein
MYGRTDSVRIYITAAASEGFDDDEVDDIENI